MLVLAGLCTDVQFLWSVFQCALVLSFCGLCTLKHKPVCSVFVVCVLVCTSVQFLWFVFQCALVFNFCGLCFSVHWCSVFVVCVSVCTQLLTASIPDDDSLQLFFQLIDKCLQHEVRTCSAQPLYITACTAWTWTAQSGEDLCLSNLLLPVQSCKTASFQNRVLSMLCAGETVLSKGLISERE